MHPQNHNHQQQQQQEQRMDNLEHMESMKQLQAPPPCLHAPDVPAAGGGRATPRSGGSKKARKAAGKQGAKGKPGPAPASGVAARPASSSSQSAPPPSSVGAGGGSGQAPPAPRFFPFAPPPSHLPLRAPTKAYPLLSKLQSQPKSFKKMAKPDLAKELASALNVTRGQREFLSRTLLALKRYTDPETRRDGKEKKQRVFNSKLSSRAKLWVRSILDRAKPGVVKLQNQVRRKTRERRSSVEGLDNVVKKADVGASVMWNYAERAGVWKELELDKVAEKGGAGEEWIDAFADVIADGIAGVASREFKVAHALVDVSEGKGDDSPSSVPFEEEDILGVQHPLAADERSPVAVVQVPPPMTLLELHIAKLRKELHRADAKNAAALRAVAARNPIYDTREKRKKEDEAITAKWLYTQERKRAKLEGGGGKRSGSSKKKESTSGGVGGGIATSDTGISAGSTM